MLLTPETAAGKIGVTVKHLRALPIPYINIGARERVVRRYDPSDINLFLETRKCQSTGETVPRPTPTISGGEVIDFQARREKQTNGAPKRGKKRNASGSKQPR